MSKLFILTIAGFLFFFIPFQIHAQETDTTTPGTMEETSAKAQEDTPTFWTLLWQAVKERVDLALTRDPAKKAEKQLKYAEQRIELADLLALHPETAKAQARIRRMINRSNDLMEKINKGKEKWSENKEKVDALVTKIAEFQLTTEAALDTIEEKLPPEAIEKFHQVRDRSLEISRQLWDTYEMDELPSKIKDSLVETQATLKQRAEETEQYRNQYQELQDKAEEGDESAQAELDKLQQDRVKQMKAKGGDIEDLKQLLQGFNVPVE